MVLCLPVYHLSSEISTHPKLIYPSSRQVDDL